MCTISMLMRYARISTYRELNQKVQKGGGRGAVIFKIEKLMLKG